MTLCTTGLGMEMVLGEPLVKFLSSTQSQVLWKGAQLAFSLLVFIALFARSFSTLPYAVLGLWKMGFPETAGCFRRSFGEGKVDTFSVCAYLNGLGFALHHMSAAYLISACTMSLIPLDRRVIAISGPLICQHLVVLVRYWSVPAYGCCEVILEIVFEWEVFTNISALSSAGGYDITTRGICLSMLVAHWFYWAAAAGEFFPVLLGCPKLRGPRSVIRAISPSLNRAAGRTSETQLNPAEPSRWAAYSLGRSWIADLAPTAAPLSFNSASGSFRRSSKAQAPPRSPTPERWKFELTRRPSTLPRREQFEQMATEAKSELNRRSSRAEAFYQEKKAIAEATYQARRASAIAALRHGREQVAAKVAA